MNDRGIIRNVERKQQINDFSKLLIGNITPTDIDGLIEYKDKAYIFFEVKYKDADLPGGQRLALERLARDTIKAGKKTIILIAQHDIEDTSASVDVSRCQVRSYFFMNKWNKPKSDITVDKAIHTFLELN